MSVFNILIIAKFYPLFSEVVGDNKAEFPWQQKVCMLLEDNTEKVKAPFSALLCILYSAIDG